MREVVWKSLKAGLPAPIYMEVYAFWQAAKRTEGGERRNGRLLGANGKLQKKIPFSKEVTIIRIFSLLRSYAPTISFCSFSFFRTSLSPYSVFYLPVGDFGRVLHPVRYLRGKSGPYPRWRISCVGGMRHTNSRKSYQ